MKLAHYILPLALTVAATSAQATVDPNGSFSGFQIGAISTTTTGGTYNLGTTTQTITVGTNHGIASTSDPYQGVANNLSILNGGTVTDGDLFTLSSNTFSTTPGVLGTPLVLIVDSYTFTFTTEFVTSLQDGNIGLYFAGNLTADSAGLLTVPSAASFSAAFTSSAPTGAIGATYSINTPPAPLPGLPEPATLSLFGLGVAALGANRRKAKKAA